LNIFTINLELSFNLTNFC